MGDIILRVANLNASGRLPGIAAGARSLTDDHVLADAARLDPDKVFGGPLGPNSIELIWIEFWLEKSLHWSFHLRFHTLRKCSKSVV